MPKVTIKGDSYGRVKVTVELVDERGEPIPNNRVETTYVEDDCVTSVFHAIEHELHGYDR